MKTLLINILFLLFFVSSTTSFSATIKSTKCSASNFTVKSNYSCFVKAYKRDVATITMKIFIDQKFDECFLDIQLMYKQKTSPYFRTLFNSTIDACEFMKGVDKSQLLKLGFDLVKDHLPKKFIHPCPYDVSPFEVTNATLQGKNMGIIKALKFPDGIYKIVLRFYNSLDSNMLSVQAIIEIFDKDDKNF